jgi:hypothetical protein
MEVFLKLEFIDGYMDKYNLMLNCVTFQVLTAASMMFRAVF